MGLWSVIRKRLSAAAIQIELPKLIGAQPLRLANILRAAESTVIGPFQFGLEQNIQRHG